MMTDIFFYILRLGLGTEIYSDLQELSDGQWNDIIRLANVLTVTGFIVSGIEALPKEKRPRKEILLPLLNQALMVESMNRKLNMATANEYVYYSQKGYAPMIMKGQGNCLFYANGMRRMPGDIDVWISGSGDNRLPEVDNKKRYDDGVMVEVHRKLSTIYNPFLNRKIKGLYEEWRTRGKSVVLPYTDTEVYVPSDEMNLVYLLLHKYRHFLKKGIGMKQMLDYMMLLRKGFTEEEKKKCVDTLKGLHLTGFCRAVMYVMKEKLGLEDRFLLMEPDRKLGEFLFREIMTTGNFGFYDRRFDDSRSFMDKYRIRRKFFMIWKFPYDLMWYPYWKIEKIIRK